MGLSKKEKAEIRSTLSELKDVYGDFYITKNNIRLFILDNQEILFDCLKKGDKIVFDDKGIVVVLGYSDNSPRKYLKLLTRDLKDVLPLLNAMFWHVHEDVYIKLKLTNPLKDELLKYRPLRENGKLIRSGFEFVGGRGKEVLLRHVSVEQKAETPHKYMKDKDE
jgi:hypothetical protein